MLKPTLLEHLTRLNTNGSLLSLPTKVLDKHACMKYLTLHTAVKSFRVQTSGQISLSKF